MQPPPARQADPLREVIADLAEAVGALARANDASQIVRIEPIMVDLKTAAHLVGCSVSLLRAESRAGRLEFRNRGTSDKPRWSVLVSELNRWANGLPTGKPR